MIKLTKILLSGYFGFNNAGDEAILCSIIDGLKQTIPSVNIVVLSGNPEETKQLYGVKAISRLNYAHLIYELIKADLLISGGGSLLQDITGLLSIPYYLSIIDIAKLMKVPVMCFSQGVGPVHRNLSATLIRRSLNNIECITVRDKKSAKLLHEIGLPEQKIVLTADPVFFLQPAPDQRIKEILINERIPFNENGPWIGVSVRPWSNQEYYVEQIALALDQIIRKYAAHIVLLPFEYSRDYETMLKVCDRMTEYHHVYLLQNEYRADELLGVCKQLDIMLGMRLHSLIFALRNGVIPLGISYDPKIDALLDLVGRKAVGSTVDLHADDIIKNISEILKSIDEQKRVVAEQASKLEHEAWRAIKMATKIALEEYNG